jgi:Tfp pilus assembly protein FimV
MKKITLTTSFIIGVMLAVSCASGPPKIDTPPEEPPVPAEAPVYVPAPAPAAAPVVVTAGELDLTGAVKYKVKWGDTLANISRRFYRDGFYYPVIILASRDVVIKNPDKIWPGMVLTIPNLERNKANDNSRKAIKDCLNAFADIERKKSRPRRGLINGLKRRADAL